MIYVSGLWNEEVVVKDESEEEKRAEGVFDELMELELLGATKVEARTPYEYKSIELSDFKKLIFPKLGSMGLLEEEGWLLLDEFAKAGFY